MFQLIMGCFLLLFTVGLLIKYQPKTFSCWYVCLLCGLMAMVSIIAGGGSWVLQVLQTSAQFLLAACSLFHLHREKVFAMRKANAVVLQTNSKPAANKQKHCTAQTHGQNNHAEPKIVPKQTVSVQRCA